MKEGYRDFAYGGLIGLLGYLLFVFLYETFIQQSWLVSIWSTLSMEQKVLENLNLGLMDLKIVFTIMALIIAIKKEGG